MSTGDAQVLAELPEMNPGPVFRLDLDGNVQLANPAARRIYDAADLVGRSWLELCPRLSAERWAQVLQGASDIQCDAELNGRAFMFTLAHRPGSQHVFVYGGDVTALKDAERQLRDLAQFPEMNPGPVCRLDVDGKIVLANRATRTLLGRESVIQGIFAAGDVRHGSTKREASAVGEGSSAVGMVHRYLATV